MRNIIIIRKSLSDINLQTSWVELVEKEEKKTFLHFPHDSFVLIQSLRKRFCSTKNKFSFIRAILWWCDRKRKWESMKHQRQMRMSKPIEV